MSDCLSSQVPRLVFLWDSEIKLPISNFSPFSLFQIAFLFCIFFFFPWQAFSVTFLLNSSFFMLFHNNLKIAIFFTFFSFSSLHFTGEHVQGLGMLLSYHVSQHTSSDCRAQTFPNGQRLLGGGTLTACPGHSPLLCDSPLPRASSLKGRVPQVLKRCSSVFQWAGNLLFFSSLIFYLRKQRAHLPNPCLQKESKSVLYK